LTTEENEAQIPILVVDDAITMRHTVVLQLDKLGVKADSAANGIEALRRMRAYQSYGLILMDIEMPEMDGLQAAAAIRIYETENQRKPLPIIGMTGGQTRRETCIAAGMNDILNKPISLQMLQDLLNRWLV